MVTEEIARLEARLRGATLRECDCRPEHHFILDYGEGSMPRTNAATDPNTPEGMVEWMKLLLPHTNIFFGGDGVVIFPHSSQGKALFKWPAEIHQAAEPSEAVAAAVEAAARAAQEGEK